MLDFEDLRLTASTIFDEAARLDVDGAFPADGVARLARSGWLAAPAPAPFGEGLGLGSDSVSALTRALRIVGAASLPLGRLYEGHVNAVKLCVTYGSPRQIDAATARLREGALFGVWTAGGALRLEPDGGGDGWALRGRRALASGAGAVAAPLTTAETPDGALWLVAPRLSPEEVRERADLSGWTAQGMRASATGSFDFDGVRVSREDRIGAAGDYLRQPLFSGGAWRVLAVQLGGVERIFDLHRLSLLAAGRDGDPVQRARLGEAAVAVETARLWVAKAGRTAESVDVEPEVAAAFVNLARRAVETAAIAVIERAQRAVGLGGFLRANPLERVIRDLSTYLRQPFPDRALDDAAGWLFAADLAHDDVWGDAGSAA